MCSVKNVKDNFVHEVSLLFSVKLSTNSINKKQMNS